MPSLGSSYLDKKITTWSKAYGIELSCYWELGEEPFVSLMGTYWEPKKTKNSHLALPPPHPSHPPKRKPWTSWVHVALPHWLTPISIPKFKRTRY